MSSQGKTAIVTGASQGIGAGIVKAFVERDAAAGADRSGVGPTLGFEPTWFWGDHFSAVCDCVCFPRAAVEWLLQFA